jgi:hypothetical protein
MLKHKLLWSCIITSVLSLLIHNLSYSEENLTEIIKKVSPAVVTIITYDVYGKPLKQGSGFFINENGVR